MRLVNKHTLELGWFLDDQAPPYITLSHRWVGQETSLQDFTARIKDHGSDKEKILSSSCPGGVKKVVRMCQEVMSRSEDYVWVDTCCIDKTSSAELQEALNSMFRWYEQSTLCIVLMNDVELKHMDEQLPKSLWFTRAWTLQELLAPRHETFVDKDWKILGDRTELAETISEFTGISPDCFGNPEEIYSTPVAVRFSWLSQRTTTRNEDMAYAAFGLFDVNLTMLYGEGRKAFVRLQKEIISLYSDETIFLWSRQKSTDEADSTNNEAGTQGSIYSPSTALAPGPEYFAACRGRDITIDVFFDREPLRVTAKGLEIETYHKRSEQIASKLSIPLNCLVDGNRAAIFLEATHDTDGGDNRWQRVKTRRIGTLDSNYYYPTPLRVREQYFEEVTNLRSTLRHHSGNESSSLAVSRYQQEGIKFKVFIV